MQCTHRTEYSIRTPAPSWGLWRREMCLRVFRHQRNGSRGALGEGSVEEKRQALGEGGWVFIHAMPEHRIMLMGLIESSDDVYWYWNFSAPDKHCVPFLVRACGTRTACSGDACVHGARSRLLLSALSSAQLSMKHRVAVGNGNFCIQ